MCVFHVNLDLVPIYQSTLPELINNVIELVNSIYIVH